MRPGGRIVQNARFLAFCGAWLVSFGGILSRIGHRDVTSSTSGSSRLVVRQSPGLDHGVHAGGPVSEIAQRGESRGERDELLYGVVAAEALHDAPDPLVL